jgi:hypothetical protein
MNPLIKLFSLLILYQTTTVRVPLTKEAIRQKLAEFLHRDLVEEKPVLFGHIRYTYKIELNDYSFKLLGPYGRKTWVLVMQGDILDAPGGSILRLSLRLATSHLALALLAVGWYVCGAIFFIKFPLEMLPILMFQVLFMYGVILCVFRWQAEQNLNLLKRTLNVENFEAD